MGLQTGGCASAQHSCGFRYRKPHFFRAYAPAKSGTAPARTRELRRSRQTRSSSVHSRKSPVVRPPAVLPSATNQPAHRRRPHTNAHRLRNESENAHRAGPSLRIRGRTVEFGVKTKNQSRSITCCIVRNTPSRRGRVRRLNATRLRNASGARRWSSLTPP